MVDAVQAVARFQHQSEVSHELGDAPVLAAGELLLHLQQAHALARLRREDAAGPAPAAAAAAAPPFGPLVFPGGNAPQGLQERGGEAAVLLLQELAQDAVALLQLVAQLLPLTATARDHRRRRRLLLVVQRGGAPPAHQPRGPGRRRLLLVLVPFSGRRERPLLLRGPLHLPRRLRPAHAPRQAQAGSSGGAAPGAGVGNA